MVNTASAHAPFTLQMQRSSTNTQVSALQTFLSLDSTIYPEGLVTGFFGAATQRAVQRFQIRYAIVAAGAPGYGTVGPKTRAKMNALVTP